LTDLPHEKDARHYEPYSLAIRGTVEERILKLQAPKCGLVEAALNDQAPMMEGLTESDLEALI
jgi:SNF2 family DNA or RNA helicase